MKIALAHDYLNQYGGAERVLQVLYSLFPEAPLYTTIYDAQATRGAFEGRTIRTSFLQRAPLAKKYHHAYSFLMPMAVEQFDTASFDVVFSVASSFAKGLITKPHTKFICYCLTPPRFLWDDSQKFLEEFTYPRIVKKIIPPFLSYLRVWDHQASRRPDRLIAISDFVRQRIKKYYGIEASVIYPPVDTARFNIKADPADYFLMVGRLVAYKKFDLAIRAFNKLGWPLKIAGIGPELKYLKSIAAGNVQFLGDVSDEHLAGLYGHAQALIFPQEEDFGIVPIEAMACGRPVIAYRGGGAVETVVEGKTGLFFNEQTAESLMAALEKFKTINFDARTCRAQAEKFSVDIFKEKIMQVISAL